MISKINFTYKKPSQNSKSYLIIKEELVKQKIKENEKKSLINCINLKNKVDSNKIQNTNSTIEQSSENNINNSNINNTIIEMELSSSSTINTGIIDNVIENKYINYIEEIEKNLAIADKYIHNFNINIDRVGIENFSNFALIEKASNIYVENEFVVPFNVGRIHQKGIRIINNVYQSKYKYGKGNSSGLGDFLRGCYFILEFCEKYNFQPKIIFNNCISKFLLIKTHNLSLMNNVLNGINLFKNNNFREYIIENGIIKEPLKNNTNIMADFVEYIVQSPQYNGNVFMYCNSFPINEIPEKNKAYMRRFLEPSNEMKIIIKQTLDELKIYSKQYIVIHIRAGDSYLTEDKNTFTNGYIYDLINNIKNDIRNDIKNDINGENNYLLLADSNDVKKIIQKYFPTFKTLMNPITHLGEGLVLEEEKVKNTMIDFYLLSFAKSIFAYSSYTHGTGFSYWCAKTFNIPHVCKYIQ